MAKNSCLKRRILLFLHFIVVSFQTSSSQSTYSFAPFVDLQSTTPVLQPADSYINFDSLSWHCKNNECQYVHSKYIKFNATGINFNRSYSYYYCYSVATDEVQQLYDITCNGYGSCDLKDKTTNSWPESTITSQIYTYSTYDIDYNNEYSLQWIGVDIFSTYNALQLQLCAKKDRWAMGGVVNRSSVTKQVYGSSMIIISMHINNRIVGGKPKWIDVSGKPSNTGMLKAGDTITVAVTATPSQTAATATTTASYNSYPANNMPWQIDSNDKDLYASPVSGGIINCTLSIICSKATLPSSSSAVVFVYTITLHNRKEECSIQGNEMFRFKIYSGGFQNALSNMGMWYRMKSSGDRMFQRDAMMAYHNLEPHSQIHYCEFRDDQNNIITLHLPGSVANKSGTSFNEKQSDYVLTLPINTTSSTQVKTTTTAQSYTQAYTQAPTTQAYTQAPTTTTTTQTYTQSYTQPDNQVPTTITQEATANIKIICKFDQKPGNGGMSYQKQRRYQFTNDIPIYSNTEVEIEFSAGVTYLFLKHSVAGEYRITVNGVTGWLPTEPDFQNADIKSVHGIHDDVDTAGYTQVVKTQGAHLFVVGCICCGVDKGDTSFMSSNYINTTSGNSNISSVPEEQIHCRCTLCSDINNNTSKKKNIVASNGGAQIFRILNGAHLTIKYLALSGVNQSSHCHSSNICKGETYSQLANYEYTEMEYRETRSCYSCYGSAIYLGTSSKLTMIHSTIKNNIGGRGAIYGAYNADITIQHSMIISNVAKKLKCETVSKTGNAVVGLSRYNLDHGSRGDYFGVSVGIYKNLPSYSTMSGKGARFTIEVRGPLRYSSYGTPENHYTSITSHKGEYNLQYGNYDLTWYYNVPTTTTSTMGNGARFNISIYHKMYNNQNNSIGHLYVSHPGSHYTTFDKLMISKDDVGLEEDIVILLRPQQFYSSEARVENVIIENGGNGYSLYEYVKISNVHVANCWYSDCFIFYINDTKYLNSNATHEVCLSDGSGGGIYASPGSRVSINHSTIQNNSAEASGGGIKYHQGHVKCVHYSRTFQEYSHSCDSYSVSECEVDWSCRKESMQGLSSSQDRVFIVNNTNISHNMANVSGGGIYVTYARKTNFFMYNSNITGNVASSKGGGIVIDTSNFKSDSNDEYQPENYTQAKIIDTTIENNVANSIANQGHQIYYTLSGTSGKLRKFITINMKNKFKKINPPAQEMRDHFSSPAGVCYESDTNFYSFYCGVTSTYCSDTVCGSMRYCSNYADKNRNQWLGYAQRAVFGVNCFGYTTCTPGKYVGSEPTNQDDRYCYECDGGRYSTGQNAKYCIEHSSCHGGEYIATFGTKATDHTCGTCLAGTYNTFGDTSGACKPCEIGSFTMCEGRDRCDKCPDGMTTDEEGATMCKSAMLNIIDRLPPTQLFANVPLDGSRKKLCIAFEPDTSINANGETQTTYFVQFIKQGGSFSKEADIREVMVECPYGERCTYCETSDKDVPMYLDTTSFKVGVQTNAGRGVMSDPYPFWKLASDCGATQYLAEASTDPQTWQCRTCPKGGDCTGNTIWRDIKPKFGYYRLGPIDADPEFFAECLNPMACLGGVNLQLEGRYFHEEVGHANDDMSLADDEEGCNTYLGYADKCKGDDNSTITVVNGNRIKCRPRLCRACRFGYWAQGVSNCKLCPPPLLNYVVTALGIIFVCGMLYTFIKTALDEQGKNVTSPHHHFAQPMQKIILNHLQLISLASGFPMKWPDEVEAMFEVQGVMGSAGDYMYNPACTEEAVEQGSSLFFQKQAGLLSLPFICMLLSAIFWTFVAIKNCCLRCICKKKREKFNACDKFITSTVILLYLLYPTLCKSTFSLVACKPVGSKLYLQMDLDLPCYEEEHMKWLYALFFPSLFLYILGLPMLSTCMLRCNKKHLRSPKVKFRFGILYSGYTTSAYYWETVIATRKAAVVAISVFLNNMGTELQALFALIVTVIYLIMHVDQRPYMAITDKHHTLHDAEAGALMVAFFTMWCGLLFFQDAVVGTFQLVLTVLLISFNAIYMLFAIRLYIILKVMDMDEEMADGSKGSVILIQVAKLFKCCIPHWLRGTRDKKVTRAKTKLKAMKSLKKITPTWSKRDEDEFFD